MKKILESFELRLMELRIQLINWDNFLNIMQLLIKNGCRSAGPGEYTQRAFLNGKMDLSQAEAVADLIASSSEIGRAHV